MLFPSKPHRTGHPALIAVHSIKSPFRSVIGHFPAAFLIDMPIFADGMTRAAVNALAASRNADVFRIWIRFQRQINENCTQIQHASILRIQKHSVLSECSNAALHRKILHGYQPFSLLFFNIPVFIRPVCRQRYCCNPQLFNCFGTAKGHIVAISQTRLL